MNALLFGILLICLFLLFPFEKLAIGTLAVFKKGIKKVVKKFPKKKIKIKKISFFSKKAKLKYFLLGALFSFLFLFIPILATIFVTDLPSPYELSASPAQTTKIFDRNGILLTEIYSNQNRTLVPLSEIPNSLQLATIAIEDKNFYHHPGFDAPSIGRAFIENLQHKKLQGGSTITQQLVKSSMLTPQRSITRKIKELVLAFWAERIYSKKEILQMYFNQVPYGGTAWGVEAASEKYFGKSVKEITLAQSAFLAGLTASPTTYSPYGSNPMLWKKRQIEVLDKMVALKFITKKEATGAINERLSFEPHKDPLHAPHFVHYVHALLVEKYGIEAVERGGMQVRTSLDLKTQEFSESVVKDEVAKAAPLNVSNGAAVVTNPKNGDILAMVGSHDFNDPNGGNVNLATSLRQPGSSIKVVTYTASLSNGFTPATILIDNPITFPISDTEKYSPVNYDGKFHGRVSLRNALANSYNIPAVKTLNSIGIETMVNQAKQMGIKSWGNPSNYGLSLTLGAAEVTMLDMARVNGTLANNGNMVDVNPILKITDVKGSVLEEKKPTMGEKILSPGIAFIISNILADNIARAQAFGPNSPLLIQGHTVSVKTGTTDNKRDNWTNGYTNNYAVIVWVGNNDNSPMSQNLASGITGAAPIWHRIMENLLAKNPETQPKAPPEIVEKFCLGKMEYFLKGTENSVSCGFNPLPTNASPSPTVVR